jgi:beta-galactosidase
MRRLRLHHNMLVFLGLVLSAAWAPDARAQARFGDNPHRSRVNWDEGWKFALGCGNDYNKDFQYGKDLIFAKTGDAGSTPASLDFKDSAWASVRLPHDWAVTVPFVHKVDGDLEGHGFRATGPLFPESNVGWYRKTFTINKTDSGGRFVVTFDGIFRDSRIWVNGFYLGNNLSGYCGVAYDITDFLHYGQKNVITVRVDASQYEGWFYEGAGIYRHVWLNNYNDVHLADDGGVFVHTEDGKDGVNVILDTKVINKQITPAHASVSGYITDRDGKVIARADEQDFQLPVNGAGTNRLLTAIPMPHRWNLDDPYLYRAVVLVHQNGRVVDSLKVRFGVRTITVDKDNGLSLNGKPVKIQGVCCHQDHGGIGVALPDFMQYYRIKLLKEMGTNAYRTSHNPPTPELLDACDSLGMLVLDETRLLNSGPEYENQLRWMILRDRNHPSIFMWSIGNEEWMVQTSEIGKRIAQNQVSVVAELDPTRLCTEAVNDGNVYHGVNEVLPVRGFNYNLFGVDPYRKEHPDQPIMGTEVASTVSTRGTYEKDTIKCYLPDEDSVFPGWASTAETWWTLAANRPWFMGGFAWTGFDYRGEPTPFSWPNINSHFGIMDMCGFPKNVYYYYKSWWTDGDFVHISPHWNWKGKEGQLIKVWVNTGGKDVELFINGKSLGKKDMPRNGHLYWFVPYKPGVLKAVATVGNRKVVSEVRTTGAPYKIMLSPSAKTILADGSDGCVVNVTVLDKEGNEVPDAMDLIHFSLSGPARFLGVGNGDPSSHEADICSDGQWQRHLFYGKCQIILQSNGSGSGPVQVSASADGLQGASAQVGAQAVDRTIL